MAGRHRRVRIPEQRGPRPLGITDAHTEVEHLVTDDAVVAHRHSGRYLALCGVQVLAASLTVRERTRCRPCHRRAGLVRSSTSIIGQLRAPLPAPTGDGDG